MKLAAKFSILLAASLLALSAVPASAQNYPTKPVRVVVPYSPGGSADHATRPILEKLTAKYGQSFLLEHRTGAGGEIGTGSVARAAPDGYTLLVGAAGPLTILPELRKLSYDADKDLVPIAWLGDIVSGLAVHPSLGVDTVQDLVRLAKERPGKISFPSAGYGTTSHLRGEMLMMQAGIKLLHVPYKSNADAVPDLLAGNVQLMFESLVFAQAKAGKLKLLAVLGETRHPDFPNVPTMREAGFPDYNIPLWYALYAPAGTPRPLLEQLNRDITAITADPQYSQSQLSRDVSVRTYSLERIADFLTGQRQMYRTLIKEAGVTLN
ncbi:MAG: Bug family tripartite tricarboxylate transporter substrate binding protein [Lautropia sp.]